MKLLINPDEYLPLREVVFNTLRKAIIEGELDPGERLMEITLANKLGVSRTPVREAIRMLELEGLVVMLPRKGAQVANITVKDLTDALEVRMAIEELSVKLATKRLDDEAKREIADTNLRFKEAINSKLVPAIVDCDIAFHNSIYNASKNPKLITLAQNLREQVYRYRVEYVKDFSYHDFLVREHDEITRAIFNGDEETAVRVMNEHIYNQEQIVIRNLTTGNM
ncbi:MAG: GntR family transcriptional regulator [Lachnospiraceae bacterium]|nr:GntR family transcriptional regulator [Lachnospiraceae bacterium]